MNPEILLLCWAIIVHRHLNQATASALGWILNAGFVLAVIVERLYR